MFAALILVATLACDDANNPVAPRSEGEVDAREVKGYPARVELGSLGGNISYANAINASGAVVGSSVTSAGETRAFRWTLAGGMVNLGALPGDEGSIATDIDNQGRVLGVSFSGVTSHPVTWDATGVIHPLMLPFTVPAGFDAVDPADLPNARGQFLGTAHVADLCCTTDAALFYSAETGLINLRTLGEASGIDPTVFGNFAYNDAVALNEGGTVLGLGGFEDAWRPFLWSPTGGFHLLGVPPASAPYQPAVVGLGLNNADEVVGWFQSRSSEGGPGGTFRWSPKKGYTVLSNGFIDNAAAINDKGDAVGNVFIGTAYNAVAWTPSGQIKLLATKAGNASIALDINGDGLAVGWEGSGSGLDNHAVLWNTDLAKVVPGGKANGPNFASRARGRNPASSAFEARITRCLRYPSSKTARAVCLVK
jgi:probable HAF family extracellular repeat protein